MQVTKAAGSVPMKAWVDGVPFEDAAIHVIAPPTGTRRAPIAYVVIERGCHICVSHLPRSDGYPALWADGRDQHMHRVLFEEKHGPLGPLVLRHTCDNRRCINGAHHVPGTHQQNSADMVARGRCNTSRGEARSDARLSAADVAPLRESSETQCALAARLGVNQSTISRIRSGEKRKFD